MNDKYNSAADKIEAIIDQYGHINGEETDRATLLTILREALEKISLTAVESYPGTIKEYAEDMNGIITLAQNALSYIARAAPRLEAERDAAAESCRLMQDRVARLVEANLGLREAALAYADLATCYRLGKAPSEGLFHRLDIARDAIEGKK